MLEGPRAACDVGGGDMGDPARGDDIDETSLGAGVAAGAVKSVERAPELGTTNSGAHVGSSASDPSLALLLEGDRDAATGPFPEGGAARTGGRSDEGGEGACS